MIQRFYDEGSGFDKYHINIASVMLFIDDNTKQREKWRKLNTKNVSSLLVSLHNIYTQLREDMKEWSTEKPEEQNGKYIKF